MSLRNWSIASLLLAAFAGPTTAAPPNAGPLPDLLEKAVARSIERGVAGLKKLQSADGNFGSRYGLGGTALAALALLECGVRADDPAIVRAAAVIRKGCVAETQVYHLSLDVMFLDRLSDPHDQPFIQAMGLRLLAGQNKQGGWTYGVPAPSVAETDWLRRVLEGRSEMAAKPRERPNEPPPLAPEAGDELKRLEKEGLVPPQGGGKLENRTIDPSQPYGDNSNTQFAILGLWVARRHGVPVDEALRFAEVRFRSSHVNGTWGYTTLGIDPEGRRAMTCAGLLGLATGIGVRRDARLKTAPDAKEPPVKNDGPPKSHALPEPLRDPLVLAGLNFVADQLGVIVDEARRYNVYQPNLYFLWSLERVAVCYDLSLMAGRNWYLIGATLILVYQQPDTGCWTSQYPPEVDTSFALLFLSKSNVASDLTANLRRGKSQASLKASGSAPGENAATGKAAVEPPLAEADRLVRDLVKADADGRAKLLAQYRDAKGAVYTEALVKAIPQLSGESQSQARDALAERLSRMTAGTIRGKFRDKNAELRRAAAVAAAMKEDKAFVPDLIVLLDDLDPWVVRAAGVGLRVLTGLDFGPSANATPEERAKAVAAWKAWWRLQPKP